MHEAERGLFDLRRGRPLYVAAPNGHAPHAGVLLATVESLSRQTLEQIRQLDGGQVRLALTHHRTRAMGLTNGDERSMSVGLNSEVDVDQILRLSSATGNYAIETFDLREASTAEIGGLALARLGLGFCRRLSALPRMLPACPGCGRCWTAAQCSPSPQRRLNVWRRTREWILSTSATGRFLSRMPRTHASCASARPTAFSSTWRL